MPLLMVGPLLDLVAPVPNLGSSHIVFSPHNHPPRECCPTHFLQMRKLKLDATGGEVK